jgi:hypothetical protein
MNLWWCLWSFSCRYYSIYVILHLATANYFKKADHRYWKLINHALTWERPNLFLSMFMPVARMLQHVMFAYLANTAVVCYSLTIICCCQVHNYIYWIISTENDHRHHHKFIKSICVLFFWTKKTQNYRYRNYCPWWQEFNLTRLYSYDLLCEPVLSMHTA